MPWELGFFDGLKGKVGVLPIKPEAISPDHFEGREYLKLYPRVERCEGSDKYFSNVEYYVNLCVIDEDGNSVLLRNWIEGS